MSTVNRNLGKVVLLLGLVAVIIGVVFIGQGIAKNNMITGAMSHEQITYGGSEEINGFIDTAAEANLMATVLMEHRMDDYGIYSELGREDPNRVAILKAMTMENSLNLSQMGFGLVTVVIVSGIFMVIMGIAVSGTGLVLYRLGGRA